MRNSFDKGVFSPLLICSPRRGVTKAIRQACVCQIKQHAWGESRTIWGVKVIELLSPVHGEWLLWSPWETRNEEKWLLDPKYV